MSQTFNPYEAPQTSLKARASSSSLAPKPRFRVEHFATAARFTLYLTAGGIFWVAIACIFDWSGHNASFWHLLWVIGQGGVLLLLFCFTLIMTVCLIVVVIDYLLQLLGLRSWPMPRSTKKLRQVAKQFPFAELSSESKLPTTFSFDE